MVIFFALVAALANAVNEATQHVASTAAPSRSSGWKLVVYLFRNPLWLLGWAALAAAFVFQALALSQGQISVVQPLLATELVFMLLLRRVWIHQSIRPITWAAATVTCVGLTVFIAAGQPGGGQSTPARSHWFTAGLACCAAAAVLAVLARWGSPSLRAALYGSASGHVGAGGDVHQSHHRHANPVRRGRNVRPLARLRLGRRKRSGSVPDAGSAACRAAAGLPAVPRDHRPDRQHRAERVAVRRALHS